MVTTTIVGEVVDESEKPIEGASVTAHGQSTITDKNGIFFFHNIQAPSDRCFAVVKYNGYFDGVRAEQTRAGEVTRMKLTLGIKETAKLNATQGGLIKIGKASVQFTPNSIVTEVGTPYSGEVTVAYKHLDPDADNFFDLFPGDFEAIRTDNSSTYLTSYGVLQAELTGSSGEKLNLASGKTATLAYPIPASLASNTPSSIPLWYFDEQLGIWKEEGSATKVGNIYVGTVTHFTPWNCDSPALRGSLTARIACDGHPIEGIEVIVGERKVTTGKDGRISVTVPADWPIPVSVKSTTVHGIYYASNKVTVQVDRREVKDIGDILLTSDCPSRLSTQIVGCDGNPISGVVYAEYYGGNTFTATLDGKATLEVPSNKPTNIFASTFNGKLSAKVDVESLKENEERSLSNITICRDDVSSDTDDYFKDYLSIPIDNVGTIDSTGWNVAKFSFDGKFIAIVAYELSQRPVVKIYDTKTGSLVQTIKDGLEKLYWNTHSLSWSLDNSKILVEGWPGSVLLDAQSGKAITVFKSDTILSAVLLPEGNQIVGIKPDDGVGRLGFYSVNGKLEKLVNPQIDVYLVNPSLEVCSNHLIIFGVKQTEIWNLLTKTLSNTINVKRRDLICVPRGGSFLLTDVNGSPSYINPFTEEVKQASINVPIRAISNNKLCVSAAPSSQGTSIAALYDGTNGNLIRILNSQQGGFKYKSFDFSEDGRFLLGYHTKGIMVWRVKK